MRIASCVTKATDTRSQYIILSAFLQQQWLYERACILRYTHITLSCYIIVPCLHGSSNKQYVSSSFSVKILFILRAACPTHSTSWILLAYQYLVKNTSYEVV